MTSRVVGTGCLKRVTNGTRHFSAGWSAYNSRPSGNRSLKDIFGISTDSEPSSTKQPSASPHKTTAPNPFQRPESVSKPKTAMLGQLLAKIFSPNKGATDQIYRQAEVEKLRPLSPSTPSTHSNSATATSPSIDSAAFSSVLYWYTMDMSFKKSDFQRILPPPAMRVGTYPPELDSIDFEVVRSRDPETLARWMGHYLIFPSQQAASLYYNETIGADLCGLQVKFQFVAPDARGISSPVLAKSPVSRRSCVLIYGLPAQTRPFQILRTMWRYDFVTDDDLAIERLPKGKLKYGGSPYLLRFKTEHDAARVVRDYNGTVFPHTESRVFLEIAD